MGRVDFLRQVPVLADLSDPLLEQLASEARDVRVEAGEWLFREGDEASSLYVIRSGRIEVVAEGDPETLIRVLGRGQVMGELALLGGGTRSASVRARRDTELIELSRDQFEGLISSAPSFAVGLTRAIGAQLAASRTPVVEQTPPATIAVVGLDDSAPVEDVADGVAQRLRNHGSLGVLSRSEAGDDWATALDRAEESNDRLLLIGESQPANEWTAFCIREADLVLAIGKGPPSPEWLANAPDLHGCELVVDGSFPRADTLPLKPREVQVVRDLRSMDGTLDGTVRRLTGTSIGLALSGGGARALAHLGVLDGLAEAGIVVDRIGAVSMGAIVGASYASGMLPEAISAAFRKSFVESNPTSDYSLPIFSVVRGKRTRDRLREFFGDQMIEALPHRFFCVSCDLVGREPVFHRAGSLYEAVRASICLPGVFPPIATADGRLLVDGGVLNNLPVEQMARAAEGPVIAVDVSAQGGRFEKPSRPGMDRLARPVRRALTGSDAAIPSLGETIVRTLTVGSVDTVAAAKNHAALVIQPRLDGIGLLDWSRIEEAREAGRIATIKAIEGGDFRLPA